MRQERTPISHPNYTGLSRSSACVYRHDKTHSPAHTHTHLQYYGDAICILCCVRASIRTRTRFGRYTRVGDVASRVHLCKNTTRRARLTTSTRVRTGRRIERIVSEHRAACRSQNASNCASACVCVWTHMASEKQQVPRRAYLYTCIMYRRFVNATAF